MHMCMPQMRFYLLFVITCFLSTVELMINKKLEGHVDSSAEEEGGETEQEPGKQH